MASETLTDRMDFKVRESLKEVQLDYSPSFTKLVDETVSAIREAIHQILENLQESFAQRCFTLIDEYSPGFSSSVIGFDMLTPPDLEREIGLTGSGRREYISWHYGTRFTFVMRPLKEWTPVQGLYLCGSGAHPGGGVMGAPGRNAAREILKDFKELDSLK